MHKQSNRQNNRKSSSSWNANRRIPESASVFVKSITDRFVGDSFAVDYLRSSFLSKFAGDGSEWSPSDRRSRAIARWKDQERTNRVTNTRLRGLDRGYNILPRITFYRFLQVAQHFIAQVLGDLSDEIVLGEFSGGASTGRRRTSSSPAEKFSGLADATLGAIPYVDLIHRQSELFRQYNTFYSLNEVSGAILFTVPKKRDIDRCACKEPEINMFLQKGVGKHIRSRLRRFGINLNDQSINRSLARKGALDGSLATIDLSSASDSVTTQCVRALLPHDWFLYLNDIRSTHVVVDGTLIETEMFSSMGNGFTFELESLIFWALLKATAYLRGHPGIISVYGDDLIIPSGMYDDCLWILSEFGFTPNFDKSFHVGPFRESCGGHYHLDEDVTPFYLRTEPTRYTDVIRICNQLRFWALIEPARQYENPWIYPLWVELRNLVPSKLWGGYDLEVDTSLASPSGGCMVLHRVSAPKSVPEVGRYLQWHNSNRNRSSGGLETPPPVRDLNWCRTRRAKQGALAFSFYFREELE